MMKKRSHQIPILLAVFALLAAACGGGDDDSADTTAATTSAPAATTAAPGASATTSAPAQTTAAPAATTEAPSSGGGGLAPNMAIVTVGDKTYEFDAEAHLVGRCDPAFFGAFWVIAAEVDGPGGLEMFFVPEGDTNHDETSRIVVNVKDTDGREWHADADGGQGAVEGTSSVDSVVWDGNTVTGTASFIDTEVGDDATATGTFEATCP
jgi:hypothetical protein